MSASTAERTDLSATVTGMGIALLKVLPTRDCVQDRSAKLWGDYEIFAANESQIYVPSMGVNAPMID